MNIEKFPLAERIRRCKDGRTAYPEYIPSVIRSLAEMPVMEYLAGLDPKRQQRFATLVGLRPGNCTYQWAALRVCELTEKSPALAAEAMRILADPMIRYDDLTNQAKPPHPAPAIPPVPQRRRSPPGEKLPLADRLRQARQGKESYLHIYRLYTDAYFYNLDVLFGGSTYADTLEAVLSPYLQEYGDMPLLTRFVADSRELPAADQIQLLYQVLIHPFAELQKEKERIDRECMSLPF